MLYRPESLDGKPQLWSVMRHLISMAFLYGLADNKSPRAGLQEYQRQTELQSQRWKELTGQYHQLKELLPALIKESFEAVGQVYALAIDTSKSWDKSQGEDFGKRRLRKKVGHDVYFSPYEEKLNFFYDSFYFEVDKKPEHVKETLTLIFMYLSQLEKKRVNVTVFYPQEAELGPVYLDFSGTFNPDEDPQVLRRLHQTLQDYLLSQASTHLVWLCKPFAEYPAVDRSLLSPGAVDRVPTKLTEMLEIASEAGASPRLLQKLEPFLIGALEKKREETLARFRRRTTLEQFSEPAMHSHITHLRRTWPELIRDIEHVFNLYLLIQHLLALAHMILATSDITPDHNPVFSLKETTRQLIEELKALKNYKDFFADDERRDMDIFIQTIGPLVKPQPQHPKQDFFWFGADDDDEW